MRVLFIVLSLAASSAAAQTPAPAVPAAVPPASPGAPAAATTAGTTTRAPEYTLGVQDSVKVTVFDEPQLSGTYRVDGDGAFAYPFLGVRIAAAGRTLREVEAEITKRLVDGYVRRPQVMMEVEQYRSRYVFVVGEVRSPSKVALTGQMTLIEALAQAGYLTPNAGSEVVITRSSAAAAADAAPSSPEARTQRVRLTDVLAGRTTVVLQEGDTISVARAERFFVGGQVKSPGQFTWEPGLTIGQAILLAGGVSEKGSNRGLKVIRDVKGKKQELEVRADELVQPNDQIVVRQRLL
jgi:polysaccharide biosynthesis/export protein